MSEIPPLSFGDRFQIQSLRGSSYSVTLLARGEGESGLYVRLDDGRIARLDERRLKWDTFSAEGPPEEPPVRPGDEVLVDSSSGTLRGTLLEPIGGRVALRLPIGSDLELPREEVSAIHLLFRARDLKAGDHVILRSKSGNEYQGLVRALGPGRRMQLRLKNGGSANLRLNKIDLASLLVLVPVEGGDT